jgi:Spy/CpxP family protein refolding chaperone
MNRVRLLGAATIFLLALTAAAQPSARPIDSTAKDQTVPYARVPNAQEHLKMLTERLDLTRDQQDELRPIIQSMFDDRERLMDDQSLSSEQRGEKLGAVHRKAIREARKFLNEEQKKKLDELQAQNH